MKKIIKNIIATLKNRWYSESPIIFKWLTNVSVFLSGSALAVNTGLVAANAVIPDWWNKAYFYFVGVPALIAFASKFTKGK